MAGWELILGLGVLALLLLVPGLSPGPSRSDSGFRPRLVLWIAQGFGAGRVPLAPGTFGSVVGVLWFALLLATGSLWAFLLGTGAGLLVSVWFCGLAEKLLEQKDPGSVVLDEIAAIPACFVALLAIQISKTGEFPGLGYFLGGQRWLWILGVFAAFRLFDVLKPWPVGQSQALPGGWGITIDDALAAVYVNLTVILIEVGKVVFTA